MFLHLPPLNSIRVFDAAARLKSFKAAALELNVTPTAVSHQIRSLEDTLGTLLFERKTRAIELTEEGEKLAQVAYLSLQQLSSVISEITHSQSTLTVSTTASFAALWLVPRLEKFHQQNPTIQVVVKTGEQLDDFERDRRIDLVIRYGRDDEEARDKIKLVTETIGAYTTPLYLKNVTRIEDACLIETKWKNQSLPSISWSQVTTGKIKEINTRHFDQEHHVVQAALAGQGIGLVSSLLVETAVEQGWLVEFPNHPKTAGLAYYSIIPSHNARDQKVKRFQDWLLLELRNNKI
ncbi:LysR family transcriptional regulator [Kiloniella litopenaei]|uniref:LysR family transcriptional regulator n=1 Tax=Kiloniella litopenaei TaxID=1549748 RepID=A0A0M2RC54_9PROT|nr:LysR substrate-binding domain-containing protein [Kiloniella litopenaei]KKJ77590.1 LysR family transcriptional regulator [Kiloniella litopenaei]